MFGGWGTGQGGIKKFNIELSQHEEKKKKPKQENNNPTM